MRKRYFLRLAYQGTHYHGWQIQPNAITVQEVLNKRISVMLGEHVSCYGCGRTDTGVHARDFVAHFDTDRQLDGAFVGKLNRFLPADIAVYHLYESRRRAHARFDAQARTYKYYVTQIKNPFATHLKTYFYQAFDPDALDACADLLTCYTDFESFCKAGGNQGTYACTIHHAHWEHPSPYEWVFEIKANRFLRGMVRLLVGTMFCVARGKMRLDAFRALLDKSADPKQMTETAPADGLYLDAIDYPEDLLIPVESTQAVHN